jgi:quercetin dioxygenase-like cupin family protein
MTRVVPPGGGEIIGDSPDRRVEILSDDDALNATWSRFGAGRDGADLHVHRRHTDLFYVLEGSLTLRLGAAGEEVAVPAGTLARIPPLVVHGFRNGSDAEVRYLNLHAPGRRFVDYLRAMRDGATFVYDQEVPPADGGRTIADAVIGGEPSVVEDGGRRAALLADVEEIAAVELRLEAAAGCERHAHDRAVESLYLLEGELALEADDEGERHVSAGSWVQFPAGLPHAWSAATAARVLELHTPRG